MNSIHQRLKICLGVLVILASTHVSAQTSKKVVTPTSYYKKVRIVSGNNVRYYTLTKNKPVIVDVPENGRLKVFSRARLNLYANKPKASYTIVYSFDKNPQLYYQKVVDKYAAKEAAYQKNTLGKTPSIMSKFIVDVPNGVKQVKFYVKSNGANKVDAHFSFARGRNPKTTWKNAAPSSFNNGSVQLITGKRRTHYKLSSKKATKITLEGPSKLYVYSRVRIEANKQLPDYTIKYTLDGKVIKQHKHTEVGKSNAAIYKSGSINKVPGKLKYYVVEVPPGKHEISFMNAKPGQEIDAYFRYKKSKKTKPEWKDIKTSSPKTVLLKGIGKKYSQKYTRLNSGKSTTVSVTGPTRLRILIRPEFQYYMHADNIVRVEVKKDGKLINTYKVSSKRSKKTIYVNNDKLIPGTLNKIYLKTPAGKHTYTFTLLDKGKSALIRVNYDKNYPQ